MKKISFFITDDHQIILDGLEKIILEEPGWEVAGTASNGKECIERVPIAEPDVVLMDLDMPVLNGLATAERLLASFPDLSIVILSMYGEKEMVQKMMEMGVKGYFLKNTDKEELKMGLRHILRGKRFFQADALEGKVIPQRMAGSAESIERLGVLSERELDVLKEIAKGKSTKQIAEELHLSPRTIETHRKNLHQKLEVNNVSGLVRIALKSGLVE